MKFMIPEKLIVNKYFKKLEYDYVGLVNRYRIPDNNKIVNKVLNSNIDCISMGKKESYSYIIFYVVDYRSISNIMSMN